jgi:hypothetical protein
MTHSERTRFRRAVLHFWRYCVQSLAEMVSHTVLQTIRPAVEDHSIFDSLSPLEAAEVMAVVDVAQYLVVNVFTWNLDGDDGFCEQRQRVTGSLTDDGTLVDFQSALVSSGPGDLHEAWKVRFVSFRDHRLLSREPALHHPVVYRREIFGHTRRHLHQSWGALTRR